MSTFVQVLVDRDATAEVAEALEGRVVDWLQGNGVIAATPVRKDELVAFAAAHDVAFPKAPVGWPPGPRVADFIEDGGTEKNAECSTDVSRNVHALFDEDPTCPAGHPSDGDAMEPVGAWFGGDDASVSCARCAREYPIGDWDFGPGMALGEFAIRFDNWGRLCPALIEAVAALLAPHRVKLVAGRL